IVRALVTEMELIAVSPSSNPLENIPEGRQIDFAAVVPLQLQTMLESGMHDRLRRIRTILVGGAPVSRHLREMILAKLNGNVYQTSGISETFTHVELDRIPGAEESLESMPGVVCGQDEQGGLTLTSPVVDRSVVTNELVELM